jgi:hypothetical protein
MLWYAYKAYVDVQWRAPTRQATLRAVKLEWTYVFFV